MPFGFERANANIGFRRNAPRFTDEWRAEDSVRIRILVASPWSSCADVHFPFVDEVGAYRYFASGDVSVTAILIDQYVTGRLGSFTLKERAETKGSAGTDQLVETLVFRQQ